MAKPITAHSLLQQAKRYFDVRIWLATVSTPRIPLFLFILISWIWVWSNFSFALDDQGYVLQAGERISSFNALVCVLVMIWRICGGVATVVCALSFWTTAAERSRLKRKKDFLDKPYTQFKTLNLMSGLLGEDIMGTIRRESHGGTVSNGFVYNVVKRHLDKCVGSPQQQQRAILLKEKSR